MAKKLGLNHKQAWTGFFLAYDQITKEIDLRMRKAEVISLDVYDLLLVLEMAPDRRLRMSELADGVSRSMSGVTRFVDRLEKEGLIRRGACPNDRRVVYVSLTAKGFEERERAWPVYETAIQELFADKMSVQEAVTLSAIFERIKPLPEYLRS